MDAGRQVFSSRCANCHGTVGTGGEFGPSIVARIPLRNDAELEAVIREGVTGAGMPAFPNLSRTEATDPVAFLRTLRPRANAGPRRTKVTLTDGKSVDGVVPNESRGELQLLGDDRALYLLREGANGRHRRVTSQAAWPAYDGQPRGGRYSPPTQITPANVSRMAPKWVFTIPNSAQPADHARRRGRRDVRH